MSIDPDHLGKLCAGQFLLCCRDRPIPPGWAVREQSGWRLAAHPKLPVRELQDASTRPIGWMLGWAISPEGRLGTGPVQLDVDAASPDAPDRVQDAIYRRGGRFACVLLIGDLQRFYLDPCGSLAAVYGPRQQEVASTPPLIAPPDDGDDDRDEELIELMRIGEAANWYPFGLTPRTSVERVLPNHYLDLRRWRVVRHWPAGEIPVDRTTEQAARNVADVLRRQVAAVADRDPIHLSLTAGRDSRMILACARDRVEQVEFFTVAIPCRTGRRDCDIARRIARKLGLRHRVLPAEEASAEERRAWLDRTGWCVCDWDFTLARTYARLDPDRHYLTGQAGDVVRACYWRARYGPETTLTPEILLKEMQLPANDRVRRHAAHWLDGLPVADARAALDLLYIEQRLGCWAGPRDYGQVTTKSILYPFNHRDALDAMLRINPEDRHDKVLENLVIEQEWPELLAWPFNAPVGLKGMVHTVRDAVRRRWRRLTRRPTRTKAEARET